MSYAVDIEIFDKEIIIEYDNGDKLVALKSDWNRTIPSFQNEESAAELIEIAIVDQEVENSKVINNKNGVAEFLNGAIIHGMPPEVKDYLSAMLIIRNV